MFPQKLGSKLQNLVEKFQSAMKIQTKYRSNFHEVECLPSSTFIWNREVQVSFEAPYLFVSVYATKHLLNFYKTFCEYNNHFKAVNYLFKQFHIDSRYASEMCSSRVILIKQISEISSDMLEYKALYLVQDFFYRLDLIEFNVFNYCPNRQIHVKIHQT